MDVVHGMFRALRTRKMAREQYSFELLKSNSAHDFRLEEHQLPRFSSQHENLASNRGVTESAGYGTSTKTGNNPFDV
ncbi:unnamed protein product, partial [Mesorhabditis spiculigera]